MQCKHQEERERLLLDTLVRPFLVEAGRMHVGRQASDASSALPEDVQLLDTTTQRVSDRVLELPPIVSLHQIRPELNDWLEGRRQIKRWQNRLNILASERSLRLANLLYTKPNLTGEEFDRIMAPTLLGKSPHAREQQYSGNLEKAKKWYAGVRDDNKKAQMPDPPLSPEWAGSVGDYSSLSKASTLRPLIEPRRIELRRRDIRRWNRGVARQTPDGPHGSPGGNRPEGPKPSPKAIAILQSPTPGEAAEGAPATTLSQGRMADLRRRVDVQRNIEREKMRVSDNIPLPRPIHKKGLSSEDVMLAGLSQPL